MIIRWARRSERRYVIAGELERCSYAPARVHTLRSNRPDALSLRRWSEEDPYAATPIATHQARIDRFNAALAWQREPHPNPFGRIEPDCGKGET